MVIRVTWWCYVERVDKMSGNRVKVSIIISAYNYGKYLKLAIDSALNQDYTDGFEVIVVNDASTDDTDEICKGYGERIVCLRNERNLGVSATINRGIAIAKGNYICSLDADDTLLPGAIKWYARTLDNFPFIGLVYGDITRVNEIKGTENKHKSPDFNRRLLELRNIVYCSSQMYRKECAEAVGGYDEKGDFSVDWDLWLRITERFCALHLPRLIEKRTIKDESMTGRVRREENYEKWVRYVLMRLKKRKLINGVKGIFYRSSFKNAEGKLRQAKMKQALNQCDFIVREVFPKKALVCEDTFGCLTAAFEEKRIKTAKVDRENLSRAGDLGTGFDLAVFWNVLESFPEEEAESIISQLIKNRPRGIILLVETKEFYDGAFDLPTKPRAWWIEKFKPAYKEYEPKTKRPVIKEDSWFYNYGLDKAIFLKSRC